MELVLCGGFSELVVSRGDFVFSPPPAASTDELRVGVDCVLTCRLLLRRCRASWRYAAGPQRGANVRSFFRLA